MKNIPAIKNIGAVFAIALAVLPSLALSIPSLPAAPTDPVHPGSKVYSHQFAEKRLKCSGRDVWLFLPVALTAGETFPAVVYGHGQSLDVENYRGTMEHLAKKGIAAIFPTYDTGFFDQDWPRMGRDYVNLAACAVTESSGSIAADQIVFSGHSKGAYVASVAAGVAEVEALSLRPKAIVLFEAAGFDSKYVAAIAANTATTVVFSDRDTVVKRNLSESIYNAVPSLKKQFIFMKSYTSAEATAERLADHYWPLTKGFFMGGGAEGPLHYYGGWKWLVAAARDLKNGGLFKDEYLYGAMTAEKGLPGFNDDVR